MQVQKWREAESLSSPQMTRGRIVVKIREAESQSNPWGGKLGDRKLGDRKLGGEELEGGELGGEL